MFLHGQYVKYFNAFHSLLSILAALILVMSLDSTFIIVTVQSLSMTFIEFKSPDLRNKRSSRIQGCAFLPCLQGTIFAFR